MLHKNLRVIIAILLVVSLVGATTGFASDDLADARPSVSEMGEPTGGEMMLDALLLRPFGFAGLIIGCAVWVVAVPFALMADGTAGVEKISKPLVVEPAKYTFARPMGKI